MANQNRGEVKFTGLDGKEYTLSLSTNAICSLDEILGIDDAFNTVLVSGKATIKQCRKLFFTALRDRGRHTEIETEEQASDLVIYEDMMDLLGKTVMAQSPKQAAAAAAANKEGPTNPSQ